MLSQTLNKKIDYKFAQYYHNCDFINKYNLNSIEEKPYIKDIVLELPLDEIINCFIIKFSYTNESTQIITVLFFYIVSHLMPFINFNKTKKAKLATKSSYSVKVILNKNQIIYSFLHDIHEKFKIENFKKNKTNTNHKNFFSLTEVCKADTFFEIDTILDNHIKIINIKELNFYLKLNFFNKLKVKSNLHLIQNFPFLNK